MADELLDIPLQSQTPPNPAPAAPQNTQGAVYVDPTTAPSATTQPAATSPTAAPQLPSTAEMEAALQKKGKLLTELPDPEPVDPVNNSPLASLQPENLLKTPDGRKAMPSSQEPAPANSIELATTHVPAESSEELAQALHPIKKYVKLLTAGALTLQGLYGLYKSVAFILFEYPELETLLVTHMVTQDQINAYASKAVMTLITTLLGLFFAWHMVRSKATKSLNTAVGIMIFIFGASINTFITEHFNLVDLISNPLVTSISGLGHAWRGFIKAIPFINTTPTGEYEVIWEQ